MNVSDEYIESYYKQSYSNFFNFSFLVIQSDPARSCTWNLPTDLVRCQFTGLSRVYGGATPEGMTNAHYSKEQASLTTGVKLMLKYTHLYNRVAACVDIYYAMHI